MLVGVFPAIAPLNVMHLASPLSAILSAVIFNALIIVALIPLALRGVAYRPIGAAAMLRRNLFIYGLGGVLIPFIGIKLIDLSSTPSTSSEAMKTLISELRTSLLLTLVFAVLLCGAYPLAVWARRAGPFPGKANGSLVVDKDGAVRGSALLAQNFSSDKYFQPRPSAAGTGYDAANSAGHKPRADEPGSSPTASRPP